MPKIDWPERKPVYRKKKKRTIKKADHEHDYKVSRIIAKFPYRDKNKEKKLYLVNYKKCTVCGKEKYGKPLIVTEEEYQKILEDLTLWQQNS